MTQVSVHLRGIYRHYKGGFYQVYRIAKHTETEEKVVIYRPLNKKEYWARPLNMFCDNVKVNDVVVPRFELIRFPV